MLFQEKCVIAETLSITVYIDLKLSIIYLFYIFAQDPKTKPFDKH